MLTEKLAYYGRRTIGVLFATQSLYSAGYVIIFTISSILTVRLSGSTALSGVPITIILAGAALGAWPIGRFMGRHGRRLGLALGQLCGIIGSLIAGAAIFSGMLWLFFAGLFLLGISRGTLDMGRYAAADANPPQLRARAISLVVLGGTVGAFIGPPLLKILNRFEAAHSLPDMTLPWFFMALLLLVSMMLVFVFLRPDPLDIARQYASGQDSSAAAASGGRRLGEIVREKRFILAVTAITCAHLAMFLIMTVTPVFMNQCHHSITSITWVIVAHMFGMYGLSFFVGWLVDRFGSKKMIIAGSIMLVAACLMTPMNSSFAWLMLVLFLVGLGWNCCFVAGSSMLSEMLQPVERGRIQGFVDTLINTAAGVGSLGSGFLYAFLGFNAMVVATLIVSAIPCLLICSPFFRTLDRNPPPILLTQPDET
ncbi:MAG: MFS transporter [Geobacteraceae bacterium]|nr:MFS transporter [Geobacteraceae bacterium]